MSVSYWLKCLRDSRLRMHWHCTFCEKPILTGTGIHVRLPNGAVAHRQCAAEVVHGHPAQRCPVCECMVLITEDHAPHCWVRTGIRPPSWPGTWPGPDPPRAGAQPETVVFQDGEWVCVCCFEPAPNLAPDDMAPAVSVGSAHVVTAIDHASTCAIRYARGGCGRDRSRS